MKRLALIVLLAAALWPPGAKAQSQLPAGYMSVLGNQFRDGSGNNVRLACAQYRGNLGGNIAIAADLNAIRNAGFNCVRRAWWDAMLPLAAGTCCSSQADLDAEVTAATNNNMKVIFDHHGNEVSTAASLCRGRQQNGRWYDSGGASDGTNGCGDTGTVTYATFKANTVALATRYAGNPTVIGFDLHNAPLVQGTHVSTPITWAASTDTATDAQAMCNDVGNAVNAASPNVIIFCEGPINTSTLFNGAANATPVSDLTQALAGGSGGAGVQAIKAQFVVDAIGVNTHFNFTGPYRNFPFATTVANIQNLGIAHIRDYFIDGFNDPPGAVVAGSGLKVDGIVIQGGAGDGDCTNALGQAQHTIGVLGAALESYEINNELNGGQYGTCSQPGFSFSGTTQDNGNSFQAGQNAGIYDHYIANALHGNGTTAAIPVMMSSVAFFGNTTSFNNYLNGMGNMSAFLDIGNMHNYDNPPGVSGQPHQIVGQYYNQVRANVAAPKPAMFTELSYQSLAACSGTTPGGLVCASDLSNSKQGLNYMLDCVLVGLTRCYWYELYDDSAFEGGLQLGLYNDSGAVKQVGTAIGNLISLFKDTGNQNFSPRKLNYSITTSGTVYSFVTQHSDGTLRIPVWEESSTWNGSSDVLPPTVTATVNFGGIAARADVYQPRTGILSVANCTNCTSIVLQLRGEPQVVKLTGPPTSGGFTIPVAKLAFAAQEFPQNVSGRSPDTGASWSTKTSTAYGYLETTGAAPVWIAELGASLDGSNGNLADDTAWSGTAVSYVNGGQSANGGPTFVGQQQPMSTSWWFWGSLFQSENPNGTLNADGTFKAGQQGQWIQLLYTPASGGGGTGSNTSWNPADKSALVALTNSNQTATLASSADPNATWSATDKSVNITLSGVNLIATMANGALQGVRGATGHSTGTWQLEFTMGSAGGWTGDAYFGIATAGEPVAPSVDPLFDGTGHILVVVPNFGSQAYINNPASPTQISANGTSDVAGDVVSMVFNFDTKKFWYRTTTMVTAGFAWNWAALAAQNPASGLGGLDMSLLGAGPYFPYFEAFNAESLTVNTGASAFTYPVVGVMPWNALGASQRSVRTTVAKSTGKLCWEDTIVTGTPGWTVGLANASYVLAGIGLGSDSNGIGFNPVGGQQSTYFNGALLNGGAVTSSNASKVTQCADLDTHKYFASTPEMRAAGNPWNNSPTADPVTEVGGASFSGLVCPCFGAFNAVEDTASTTENMTGTFAVATPSGYTPWDVPIHGHFAFTGMLQ